MLRYIYKKLNLVFRLFDPIINIRKLFFSVPNYFGFFRDMIKYNRKDSKHSVKFRNIYPLIHDKTKSVPFEEHYIYHPAWAARILNKTKPAIHIDIASSIHFCSIVSAFIPIKYYDLRPANLELSNLSSEQADLINLPFATSSIQSLSCMHTVEHIGLGRYGDIIDPGGDIKAINELKRVLAEGGNLLFVVPVGKPKIMYNAHRIYSYDQVIEYFKEFSLLDFSLGPDDKEIGFINNATKETADDQKYGCGCFWFKKV